MPRYIVERTFPEGLKIPVDEEGAEMCRKVVLSNEEDSVTWIHSYVSDDGKRLSAPTTHLRRKQFGARPNATNCRSIGSRRFASWTRISIANAACIRAQIGAWDIKRKERNKMTTHSNITDNLTPGNILAPLSRNSKRRRFIMLRPTFLLLISLLITLWTLSPTLGQEVRKRRS